ncbi:MAG: hypothetical protein ACRDA3_05625 [Peptostreptococcaceae bacterium]
MNIINISLIAGRKAFDNNVVYYWTKFTVHAITENMRKEVSTFYVEGFGGN